MANWRDSVRKSESLKNLKFLFVSAYKLTNTLEIHEICMKHTRKTKKTDVKLVKVEGAVGIKAVENLKTKEDDNE